LLVGQTIEKGDQAQAHIFSDIGRSCAEITTMAILSILMQFDAVIYGSYGYTGKLIVQECQSAGMKVLLSGRNASKLSAQAAETGYSFEACGLDDHLALTNLLRKAKLVIHCAGPFQQTAKLNNTHRDDGSLSLNRPVMGQTG
jgi:NADP-dependent 3-hydroxy acid dehydrogenase YdfG